MSLPIEITPDDLSHYYNYKISSSISLPLIKWDFIGDPQLENILQRDIIELNTLIKTEAYKSTIILAGSILEAVLFAKLKKHETEANQAYSRLFLVQDLANTSPPNIERWNLFNLISIAAELNILDSESTNAALTIKNYRNLIHPLVEIRKDFDSDNKSVSALVDLLNRVLYIFNKSTNL